MNNKCFLCALEDIDTDAQVIVEFNGDKFHMCLEHARESSKFIESLMYGEEEDN